MRANGRILGIAAVVLGLAVVYYFWPEGPEQIARDGLEAFATGNPERLYRYAYKYEIDKMELSERKFVGLYNDLISPRLESYEYLGVTRTELQIPDIGYATGEFVSEDGRRFDVACVVHPTDDGYKLSLMSLLTKVWLMDYQLRTNDRSQAALLHAIKEGLTKDRHILEGLGVHGWVRTPDSPFETWDKRLERVDAYLARMETSGN